MLYLNFYIIILCLTPDSDPYWAYADYSLYTCGEKTLLEKTLWTVSLPLGPACLAPAWHLQVAYSTLNPYFLAILGTTTAVLSLRAR